MEEAAELGTYQPLSFRSPQEQEYVAFLWDAFATNYEYGNYQFAFLAYHMLTMSFVYFNIWQIRSASRSDFEKALVGFHKDVERKLLDATSPFTMWQVPESTVMRFLKLIGCDNGKMERMPSLSGTGTTPHTATATSSSVRRRYNIGCNLEEGRYKNDEGFGVVHQFLNAMDRTRSVDEFDH